MDFLLHGGYIVEHLILYQILAVFFYFHSTLRKLHAIQLIEQFEQFLKGKYNANFLSFQNPRMLVFQQKQRNNCQICYKLSPSTIKLSISASGQRQSRPVWIET